VGPALLASLFDFDYVWEGFFKPEKRRWGYYVLPIVFGDRFVGRIEPRIDRDRARVEVLNAWWEDGFAPRRADGFVDAMRDALRAYLLRRRGPPRAGTPPRNREAALPRPPVTETSCGRGGVEAFHTGWTSVYSPDRFAVAVRPASSAPLPLVITPVDQIGEVGRAAPRVLQPGAARAP
jgi:Winged helix DNA-binding domain